MRRDWKMWSVHLNGNHLHNWGIGFNYYHEYNYFPFEMIAKICQIDLLFFNVTITRWTEGEMIPGL